MSDLIYKNEVFQIIGLCMEVHNNLGHGFKEVVYKDALEIEFENADIPFDREVCYTVNYKGIILPHRFYADFTISDSIIFEVKALSKGFSDEHIAQCINYLKISENNLCLLVNFGESRLNYKRIVLENSRYK